MRERMLLIERWTEPSERYKHIERADTDVLAEI